MEEVIKDYGEVSVPSKWDEITLKKYQEIERFYENKEDDFNVIDVLDILIDKDRDYINSLPAEFLNSILTNLIFMVTTPEVDAATNKIIIDDEEYIINIMERLKLGEYVAVDNVLKYDKHSYSSILAILCRKKDEIYDSRFEAEEFEKRKEMFEEQPITKILPLIAFFLNCYIVSERLSQLFTQVEEGIDLIQRNLDNSEKIGAFKKLSLNWRMKKLRKSLRSIKSI